MFGLIPELRGSEQRRQPFLLLQLPTLAVFGDVLSHKPDIRPSEASNLLGLSCGRYWVRTSDLFRVREQFIKADALREVVQIT